MISDLNQTNSQIFNPLCSSPLSFSLHCLGGIASHHYLAGISFYPLFPAICLPSSLVSLLSLFCSSSNPLHWFSFPSVCVPYQLLSFGLFKNLLLWSLTPTSLFLCFCFVHVIFLFCFIFFLSQTSALFFKFIFPSFPFISL